MKRKNKQRPFFWTFIILTFVTVGCNTNTIKSKQNPTTIDTAQAIESAYKLAYDFLRKLQNDKVDTILFCKRTCINCCDFFNIFWTLNGKKHLNKFYFDFTDLKTHSVSIELSNDKVFAELNKNYSFLKTTTIDENGHKLMDGKVTLTLIDHYCYTQISIFTKTDSIITERIKDHSFEKYTSFDQNEKGQLNDNYLENKNSKWNTFLKTIESELASMPETKSRELEILRTRKISE